VQGGVSEHRRVVGPASERACARSAVHRGAQRPLVEAVTRQPLDVRAVRGPSQGIGVYVEGDHVTPAGDALGNGPSDATPSSGHHVGARHRPKTLGDAAGLRPAWYWLNGVLNDPAGRPTTIYGHGQGTLAADGPDVRGERRKRGLRRRAGSLLGTNRADLLATRAERPWASVWDDDEADLAADLEVHADSFDPSLF
jgi:hypothetical protein